VCVCVVVCVDKNIAQLLQKDSIKM
jgi:hypothetical protein